MRMNLPKAGSSSLPSGSWNVLMNSAGAYRNCAGLTIGAECSAMLGFYVVLRNALPYGNALAVPKRTHRPGHMWPGVVYTCGLYNPIIQMGASLPTSCPVCPHLLPDPEGNPPAPLALDPSFPSPLLLSLLGCLSWDALSRQPTKKEVSQAYDSPFTPPAEAAGPGAR